jgi:MoaA/NifB/PqqE/SkfB family radical SAM enzyme
MFSSEGTPNVFEQPFETVWDEVKMQASQIRLPGACAECQAKDVCHACAAIVATESGCFDQVPKYRCDMMHAYPKQWERVKEEIL